MAGITELIQTIGDENISVQALKTCMTNISQNRNGVSKITFITDAVTTQHVAMNTGKVGLIIWCDPQAYLDALNKLKGG
ncbi:hypothetical protein ABJA24_003311 [Providencia rettgeri]